VTGQGTDRENEIDFRSGFRNFPRWKMKRVSLFILVLTGLATGGCGLLGGHNASPAAGATGAKAIVTTDSSLTATVVAVNQVGRFVVLGFSGGQMPQMGQSFFLYRAGLKEAEVRISGPRQDNNIVADLISGEAQVGDAVRDE